MPRFINMTMFIKLKAKGLSLVSSISTLALDKPRTKP